MSRSRELNTRKRYLPECVEQEARSGLPSLRIPTRRVPDSRSTFMDQDSTARSPDNKLGHGYDVNPTEKADFLEMGMLTDRDLPDQVMKSQMKE